MWSASEYILAFLTICIANMKICPVCEYVLASLDNLYYWQGLLKMCLACKCILSILMSNKAFWKCVQLVSVPQLFLAMMTTKFFWNCVQNVSVFCFFLERWLTDLYSEWVCFLSGKMTYENVSSKWMCSGFFCHSIQLTRLLEIVFSKWV